jgi:hypothetical protein
VTVAAPAVPTRRWDGPLLLLVAGIVLAAAFVALPVLLKEETRDWIAYEQAAARLDTGQPLYVWHLATEDDEYYLYPPGMAAVWAAAGSPELLIVAKVVALLAVGSLAPLVVEDPSKRRLAAALLATGAVIWPPNLYDIVLGNVMALYVGATAVVIARRGWLGASPLGVVLALAAKPAIVPFMIWLAIRHPRDAARVIAAAVAVSAVIAIAIGPGRYVEYLQALPQMTTVASSFTGNVGLVTLSPLVAWVGLIAAWAIAAFAGFRIDERRGAAIALAAILLAQPTIGFNYAGVLFPAMALLWARDRQLGTIAFVAGSLVVLVAPVAAAVLVIALAIASWIRSPGSGPAPVPPSTPPPLPAGSAAA